MSGNKFIRHDEAGQLCEVRGTQVGGTAAQGGNILSLNDQGFLDPSVIPTNIGADVITTTASVALTAGTLGFIGAGGIVPAQATSLSTTSVGFVVADAASGAPAQLQTTGILTGLTGLTVGSKYFLDAAIAGNITETPPSGDTEVVQCIGYALSTTELAFEPQPAIKIVA